MTETQRLFFALWPDQDVRDLIHKTCRRAVRHSGGKPVTPENYHVTLAFLGSLNPEQAQTARMAAASVQAGGYELVLDRLGYWPAPRVLWLGVNQVPEPARQLAGELVSALRSGGLKPDPKPFVPHVTLARKVGKSSNFVELAAIRWRISAYSLIESVTCSSGSEYTVLETWPLASA